MTSIEQSFNLDARITADTFLVTELTLSRVLLMDDANYPWLILVPRRNHITEIYQLDNEDQHLLIAEINHVAKTLANLFNADKINIAALGNVVPQLHIHIIARYTTDQAWPKPVWGVANRSNYSKDKAVEIAKQLKQALDIMQ